MAFGTNVRTGRKSQLIQQLVDWKSGEGNPIGEDGRPAPLRVLSLSLPGVSKLQDFPVDAKTDHVALADKIFQMAYDFTNEVSLSGEAQVFMLETYFGTDRLPGVNFPIQITPAAKFTGPDSPIGDLRDPRQQNSTVLRESIALTRDAWSLTGSGFRIIVESLERQVERLTAENQAMRSERERSWALQQDLMDKQAARRRQERIDNVQLAAMEMGAQKLLGYLPIITSKFDTYLMEKFGGVEKGSLTNEGKELKEVVGMILSRIDNEETAKEVFKVLKLTKPEVLKVVNTGMKFKMEEEQKKMHEEAYGAMRGLGGMQPMRALPGGKKSDGSSGSSGAGGSATG